MKSVAYTLAVVLVLTIALLVTGCIGDAVYPYHQFLEIRITERASGGGIEGVDFQLLPIYYDRWRQHLSEDQRRRQWFERLTPPTHHTQKDGYSRFIYNRMGGSPDLSANQLVNKVFLFRIQHASRSEITPVCLAEGIATAGDLYTVNVLSVGCAARGHCPTN